MMYLSHTSLEMLRDLFNEDAARSFNVAPLRIINQKFFLGSETPEDLKLQEGLAFVLNLDVHLVARTTLQINSRNEFVYGHPVKSSVSEGELFTSYWVHWTWKVADCLKIKVSGGSHEGFWTGTYDVPRDHPDYDMWNWIITVPAYLRLIREPELKRIRRVWQRINTLRRMTSE